MRNDLQKPRYTEYTKHLPPSIAPFVLITTREPSESLMNQSATQLSDERRYYKHGGLCVGVMSLSHRRFSGTYTGSKCVFENYHVKDKDMI
jgi:hypothetical protein